MACNTLDYWQMQFHDRDYQIATFDADELDQFYEMDERIGDKESGLWIVPGIVTANRYTAIACS